ncbi:MAG: ArsR/SmtB family transcription factor [Pikeienuella sp.]
MNEQGALDAFLALSNATRLRMLKCLVAAAPDGMIAGEIAKAVGASPSRASFHLTAMSEAGLVTATKHSRQITYAVDFNAMGALARYLLEDCCQQNAVVMSCCGIDFGAASTTFKADDDT